MKRALIFGVNGQDGSYLAEFLLDKGYEVIGWIPSTVPVTLDNIQNILDKITLTQGDLLDQNSLNEMIEEYRPDEIYNLASPSIASVSWNETVQMGEVAALGVARLLESIRLIHPQTHFFQASSSELFGDPVEVPQKETTPFRPRNPYGIAKLYAHWLTVNFRVHYDLYAVSGILFNHESPRRGLEFVTRKITYGAGEIKLGQKTELRLGNLMTQKDWGFAGDYVKAMWKMLQQKEPDDFVIGTGETHSVQEICELAFGYLSLDYKNYVVQDQHFFRTTEKKQLIADISKARQKLLWESETSFKQLVQMMVQNDYKMLLCANMGNTDIRR